MQDYDIIVIGGGIAGLSAALTAARLDRSVAIFTGGVPGGELLNIERIDGIAGHEDGIAGYDLCPIAQEQAQGAGAELVTDSVDSLAPEGDRWKVSAAGSDYSAGAVILATGAHIAKLGVPGEEEFTGRGVSHCATCDGPLLRGKVALVAGGGDSGMQEALTLAQHCERVFIAEKGPALQGQAAYRQAVEAQPKIEVVAEHEVIGIEGADKVEAVLLRDANGGERRIEAAGVFSFAGLEPNCGLAAGIAELGSDGRVAVDASLRTSAKGLFAAGNVRSGNAWRAASAIGDGTTAAASACAYLDSGAWS